MSLLCGIWGAIKKPSRGARTRQRPRTCRPRRPAETTGSEGKLSRGRVGAGTGQGTGAPLKRQEEDVEPGRKQSRERATEVIGPNQGRSQKRKE